MFGNCAPLLESWRLLQVEEVVMQYSAANAFVVDLVTSLELCNFKTYRFEICKLKVLEDSCSDRFTYLLTLAP